MQPCACGGPSGISNFHKQTLTALSRTTFHRPKVQTAELEQEFEPIVGARAKLWNAGHILGSASVEVAVDGVSLLFSGDLGPEHKSFIWIRLARGSVEHRDKALQQMRAILDEYAGEARSRT